MNIQMEKTMKIWNKIKSYWMWIVTGVIGIIGFLAAFISLFKRNSANKIQEKIDDNEKSIERVKGQTQEVKRQKREVKKELDDLKKEVKKTETKKKRPGRPKKSTSDAKKNIVNKTSRRKKKK